MCSNVHVAPVTREQYWCHWRIYSFLTSWTQPMDSSQHRHRCKSICWTYSYALKLTCQMKWNNTQKISATLLTIYVWWWAYLGDKVRENLSISLWSAHTLVPLYLSPPCSPALTLSPNPFNLSASFDICSSLHFLLSLSHLSISLSAPVTVAVGLGQLPRVQ